VQKFLTISSAFAALALSTPAFAGGDYCYVPMADWQSRAAAIRWAEDQGWLVQRIKIDDGCYEVYGVDGGQREFEAKLNPETFEIMLLQYESHGYENLERQADQGDETSKTGSE